MENINCIICDSDNATEYLKVSDRLSEKKEYYHLVECKCNFVYLNPRPDSQNISFYYKSEKYDPHHISNNSLWNKYYLLLQRFTFSWKYNKITAIIKLGKLLDIGGGNGEFATFMTLKGWEVMMQDKLTASINNSENNNYKFVQDLIQIKDNESFDVITLWHSLEHIHNIQELFNQINRLLKSKGILIIAVPNLQAPDRILLGNKWVAFDAPRHLYHFTPDTLNQLCNKYNFNIIRKYSLFQDTPYNTMLSISKRNMLDFIKAPFILIISLLQTVIQGPDSSSSFLVICKKS